MKTMDLRVLKGDSGNDLKINVFLAAVESAVDVDVDADVDTDV